MPVLTNPKHEAFALALANGISANQAYASAGYKQHTGNASKLAREQSIVERVSDLRIEGAEMARKATEKATEALSIDRAWLIARSEEARQLAMVEKQPSAAVSAIKEIGILAGLRVEKRENLNRNADELSDAELERIATGRGADAFAEEGGSPVLN